MKPRTKLQVEVWDLHQRLSNPRDKEAFVIGKHEFYYTTHYKNLVCLECNHQWKPNEIWHEQLIGVECPSCQKKLRKIGTENGGRASRFITYNVAQVVGRFQIFRYFSCWKHMSKKKPPTYIFHNLFEEWKDWDKKKSVIVGRTTGYTGDGFNSTPYEIRAVSGPGWQRSYTGSRHGSFISDFNTPGAEFLSRFEKYGLTKYKHDFDYRLLLNSFENSSIIETLFKARERSLLAYSLRSDSKHSAYWSQIKLAIRNKYKITDAGIWYDYLDLLRFFNKDLRSPKYVCPKNLKGEHNRLMIKKRAILEVQRIENERLSVIRRQQKLEDAISEYVERTNKFFDLEFKSGNISISILKSIDEFREEGDELKHCVFTNEYYLKQKSLIFSAKVDNKRMETIEVKIPELKIEQSRGLHNDYTEYHDQILDLLKSNLGKIKSKLDVKSNKKSNNLKVAS